MKNLKSFEYYFDLILVLTAKEIKVRYKNSILGYFWSLLHPLSMALIFFLVFKIIMRFPIENYTLYLISGLFPWQWFSNSVFAGTNSLLGNASLIKKLRFPRYFIPLSNVFNDAFHFSASLVVIFIFLIIYEVPLSLTLIYGIPLGMVSQFFLSYGVCLIVSSINLFFRDLERLVMIGLNMLFYLTPIVYESKMIPEPYNKLMFLNPLFGIIETWHNLFLKGQLNWELFLISLCEAFLIFLIGFYIFNKLSVRFAEVL